MEPMDLNEIANLMQQVREEQHRAQEGIVVVVNPSEEEAVRTGLVNAGYDGIEVVGNRHIGRGMCYIMNKKDWEHVPWTQPKHFWERLIQSST